MMASSASWSELPSDLIALISEKLTINMADYIRFRTVCTTWRYSTVDPRQRRHPPQLPWFIENDSKKMDKLSVISFSDGKKHSIALPNNIKDKLVYASYNGWCVFFDEQKLFSITLWNPITNIQVQLPSLLSSERVKQIYDIYDGHYHFSKRFVVPVSGVAMTSDPDSSEDCTLVLSMYFMPILMYWRTGDNAWNFVYDNIKISYNDVVYFKERFFAVRWNNQVVVFNSALQKISSIDNFVDPVINRKEYRRLVESCGKLLMLRYYHDDNYIDVGGRKVCSWKGITAFELSMKDESYSLVEMKSFDDQILFAGAACNSLSLSIGVCPFAKQDSVYLSEELYLRSSSNISYSIQSRVCTLRDDNVEELPYTNKNINRYNTSIWHSPRFY